MIIYIGDTRIDARRLLIRFIINALALVVADALVPGIRIEGWQAYTVMAIVLGMVNAVAKPVLELLTCPLIILTLGLFLLVLNAAMLGLAAWIAGALGADGLRRGVRGRDNNLDRELVAVHRAGVNRTSRQDRAPGQEAHG